MRQRYGPGHVNRTLRVGAVSPSAALRRLTAELRRVNRTLWAAEESVRACARGERFGSEFVALARRIQRENDRRAALKGKIDVLVGSRMREYKSHVLPKVRI
jgi:hypothetical protein